MYQVDNMHPLFRLKNNENLISYKTERYDSSPLICKVLILLAVLVQKHKY
jgi:hypothetical protein